MNSCRRLVLLSAVVLILALGGHCNASRSMNAFKIKHRPQNSTGHFLNFMPKRWIPASGPSRKHNDLGLQSWRFP
ncbi:inflorescence deficient in abscission 2 [Perilla frutescens var. hirtella]|uniref:Inflorescence deficient in abscission 2 n=1 Tax=Perilla frutescens var. hirtella TaxID=608512 RepID=A0AAD4J214_PERFH|nr:inflorescence deficient in abscission 2 [Perilla frutescens var. frutescens]KAH6788267.1 inflorescence deficient in abscission 2 [Perilla frutescens var. hirtella]KAH6812670.1 inflorescence deficient in abscission 2 [Perilla frutescens var. frutescens]KAH6825484.1 inflorescence deficient in abscission 2 [Perilla frutescens var. hirtella]